MHRRWMSLPLLASSVSAFYPYQSSDQGGSNGQDKRFIPISPPGQPSDDPKVVTIDIKKVPTKRANAFPVVLSNKPGSANAIAINQDGSDYSYFSVLKFGSKAKDMYMLIDTGSANTWVMGSGCTSTACKIHNTFGPADSSTLNTTSQTWELAYGTGAVDGVIATDKVAFGSYSINLQFGLATTTSNDFNNYPMDGILGLGPPPSNQLGTATLMRALDDQTNLQNNILGIHLNRGSDGSKDGQLTIGGVDNSKFKGQLNYLPITKSDTWEIPVDDVFVGGKACKFSGKSAIIDTGTSYILMPSGDAQIIHAQIPGSVQSGEAYTIPCGSTAQLQVAFNGMKYNISPKDYVGKASGGTCSSNIIGHQAFGPNEWILGDVFLKNVYSVFDFDKHRIGFGTMDGTVSPDSSPLSTSQSSASSAAASSSSGTSVTNPSSGTTLSSTTLVTAKSSGASASTGTASRSSAAATTTSGSGANPFGADPGSPAASSSSSSSGTSGAFTTQIPLSMVILVAFVIGFLI